MFTRIGTQPLGVLAGFVAASALFLVAFGLAFAGGRALATHDETDTIHACVNRFTGQARVMFPGQAPNCTDNEVLIEWPGTNIADDLTALAQRVAELETAAAGQEARIDELEGELAGLEGELDDQAARILELEGALDEISFDLPACLTTEGDDVVFEGCNVHIRNGMGGTATTNGTGNLIVGYNENDLSLARGGSHNLVVGAEHGYTSFGGLVAGFNNQITGEYASVTGGGANTASGDFSTVTGGNLNVASGLASSVSGGLNSRAEGIWSSISGGEQNLASGPGASVAGGGGNNAAGVMSIVCDGLNRNANNDLSLEC